MYNYSKFDPLVANGILPFPAIDMITGKAPIYTDAPFNKSMHYKPDTFTPSNKEHNRFNIKSHIATAVLTALAIFSLHKIGKNGLTKIKNFKPFEAIKNFAKNIFKKKA